MAGREITAEFVKILKTNGATAEGITESHWYDFIAPTVRVVNSLATFRNLVRTGGPWDFKSNWLKGDGAKGVEIAGQWYRRDMPGNFHYGFTGAAAGFRSWVLSVGAGVEQLKQGTSSPDYHCTAFDDPVDYEFIRLGIKLYDDVGLDVTASNLKVVLSQFSVKKCGALPSGL